MKFNTSYIANNVKAIVIAAIVISSSALLIYGVTSGTSNVSVATKPNKTTPITDADAHEQVVRYCESAIININSANRDNIVAYRIAKLRNAIDNLSMAAMYERDSVNRAMLDDVRHALKYAVLVLNGENITDDEQIEALWLVLGSGEDLSKRILTNEDIIRVDESAYINNAILTIAKVIVDKPR